MVFKQLRRKRSSGCIRKLFGLRAEKMIIRIEDGGRTELDIFTMLTYLVLGKNCIYKVDFGDVCNIGDIGDISDVSYVGYVGYVVDVG